MLQDLNAVSDWMTYNDTTSQRSKSNSDSMSTEGSFISASLTQQSLDDFGHHILIPHGVDNERVDMVDIARRENEAVGWSRLLLAVVLLIALSGMATATYIVLGKENEADFRAQFQNHASEIDTILREKITSAIKTIEAFSVVVSSGAKSTNMSWPFVTIGDYEAKAASLIELTKAHTAAIIVNVKHSERLQWEEYYRENIYGWLQEGIDYHGAPINVSSMPTSLYGIQPPTPYINSTDPSYLNGQLPVAWQIAPIDNPFIFLTNLNVLVIETIADAYVTAEAIQSTTMNFIVTDSEGRAESQLIQPIFEGVSATNGKRGRMVGAVWLGLDWSAYFQDLLPEDTSGIVLVLRSGCDTNRSSTYLINGTRATYVGKVGDYHDPKYDYMEVVSNFVSFEIPEGVTLPEGRCVPSLTAHLYPSNEYKEEFDSKTNLIYAGWVVLIFMITSIVFIIYDSMVRRRQKIVMTRVLRQHKIVSDMFPARFRDQLYEDDSGENAADSTSRYGEGRSGTLAELYPSATVMFADISGFTAWSSTREPSQVFMLLESIYMAFDQIALEHGIFKVETVGDCYVAVAGLPDPREDHALAVALFARSCVRKMSTLTKELEVNLGPDTGDLAIRVGIHSGQVTAGVLRGERSRFQLFGDTVNTASRMEATGAPNRIQLSAVTAQLLRDVGKGSWIKARKGTVAVKGKGDMQTYWLLTKANQYRQKKGRGDSANKVKAIDLMTTVSEESEEINDDANKWDEMTSESFKLLGLVDKLSSKTGRRLLAAENEVGKGATVLEEFQEIISLPKIGVEQLKQRVDPQTVDLGDHVVSQLRDLINRIASTYRENDFHNFEHASHVTSSVRKLLSRIVNHDNPNDSVPWNLIDLSGHSYGITSDPLTQFSVVFSAVIHDADHPGVSNAQLVKEKVPLALKFQDKSVAEQNSVALVWDLLMEDKYRELRSCIYTNEVELRRFRQLVVNTVMATDICDKELGALRKARWNKAFATEALDKLAVTPQDDTNRKATIVIEHLIQASDVSHTMQHWAVYKKWNERFFMECYAAYKAGRADSDPSVGWYEGEIGFFDFYVIPLAKKLESCGVFGVSSLEYLSYAISNREEWVREGQGIVQSYVQAVQEMESPRTSETESYNDEWETQDGLSVSVRSVRSGLSQISC